MSLKIKKGDSVIVNKGKDKGKTGKVLKVILSNSRLIVEGVNIAKKHMRKRSEQQPSGILETPQPLHISNVSLFCSTCKKGVRFSVKVLEDKTKIRLCKKCQNTL
ncbi:MAG: 50S ribosomal protein L24 [Candidatus Omnitrophica bacterium]|nr:50S ribosomal protein L24 [Candidatus Omnitrophota bacterium]